MAQIDPETIRLEEMRVKKVGKKKKLLADFGDVNADGIFDLILQFDKSDDYSLLGKTEAILTGNLYEKQGGTPIKGAGEICIAP